MSAAGCTRVWHGRRELGVAFHVRGIPVCRDAARLRVLTRITDTCGGAAREDFCSWVAVVQVRRGPQMLRARVLDGP